MIVHPIIGLSDSLILSELVDGVIVTVSINNVNQQIVKDSIKKLNTSTTEILGIVANNIKEARNTSKSNSKYYYQYEYNYQNSYLPINYKDDNSNNEPSEGKISEEVINKEFISRTLNKLKNLKRTVIDWINE